VCALQLQSLQLGGLREHKVLLGQPSIVEQLIQRSLMYQHHGAQLILPLCGVLNALVRCSHHEPVR